MLAATDGFLLWLSMTWMPFIKKHLLINSILHDCVSKRYRPVQQSLVLWGFVENAGCMVVVNGDVKTWILIKF